MNYKVKNFFGGNQSGKTTAGLADDIIQALDVDDIPEHLREFKKFSPPFGCRILAPSVQVLELVIYEKLRELLPDHALMGGSWQKAYDKVLRLLRFKNGSMFQFMTYEQDVGKMGGATIQRIHYDEEPPRQHRIENRIRTLRYGGDEIFTLTPLSGLSWAYEELWEEKGEELSKNIFLNEKQSMGTVIVDMDDNPYLNEENKEAALRGLSEQEKDARKSGRFVHFAGLIYDDFDPHKHVVEPFDLDPREQPFNVVVAIDPGYRFRCAVLYCAVMPDETMYIFDEIYEQEKSVGRIAEMIHQTNTMHGVLPIYYVIDPAARNRNHQTGRNDQMEYSDHGINTIAGQNEVGTGIGRVREKIQNEQLKIFSNCRNLIKEFTTYRWREGPRSGEDGKPTPVKTKDHALDALRYAVMSRPYAPVKPEHTNESQLERAFRLDRERGVMSGKTSEFGGVFY